MIWFVRLFAWSCTLMGILFLVWVFGAFALYLKTEADCFRLGYTEGEIAWDWSRYCVSRQNQSDIVVTLDAARRAPLRK